MKKTVVLIMVVTIFSKILGFGRELTLSYLYGASNISDAYLTSITIPNVIFGFVSSGIAAGFIPIYIKVSKNYGNLKANYFTNNLINLLLILVTIIITISFIFTKELVYLFASGFEGETLNLTVKFTRISLLAIYFITLAAIFKGYLEIKNNYIISTLIGLPLNLTIIVSIYLSYKYSLLVLPVGFVIASALQLLFLCYFARNAGYRYQKIINIKDQNIIRMAYIALPVILGSSVNQINVLIDKTLASQISIGGISSLNYADTITSFVLGVFVLSIVMVLYPTISTMAAENNMKGFKGALCEAITGVNLLLLPAMIGIIVFAYPIVSFLFGRGAFDSNAIKMTSVVLIFYSIGMVGFGLREILSKAFYSIQDSKTPMINATIGMIMNIILSIILSKYIGISGLALATSISALFTSGLLFISLRKKIGSFGIMRLLISFLKILLASSIMGFIAKTLFDYLIISINSNISLIISIGVGAIAYLFIIYFMKIEDADFVVKVIKSKFNRNNVRVK